MHIPLSDLLGHWVSIFLTVAILSYLYADNPFYKLAEHIFVGTSIGYVVVVAYFEQFKPNLIDRLTTPGLGLSRFIYIVPLVLVAFLFLRLTKRFAWLGRIPIAFVIGVYAGQNVPAYANADLVGQLGATIAAVAGYARDGGGWADALGIAVLVLGMIAGLVYFFFSIEHKGAVGYVARTGVWILMLGFGASFGYTVQGRISLAIGRAMECLGTTQSAAEAVQYQSKLVSTICVIGIFGTVAYLQYRKSRQPPGGPPAGEPPKLTAASGDDAAAPDEPGAAKK